MEIPTGQHASKLDVPSVASASNLPVARSRTKPNSNQQLHCHPQRLNLWPLWTWNECVSSSGAFFGILKFLRKQLQLHTRTMMAVPQWAMPQNQPLALLTLTLSILPYAIGSNGILFFWKGLTRSSILQTILPKFYCASFFYQHADYLLGHAPPKYSPVHQKAISTYGDSFQDIIQYVPETFTMPSTAHRPLTATEAQIFIPLHNKIKGNPWLTFGMSDTIHTYIMDCGGVSVYT
jgi:hypothetical protein